MGNIGPVRRKYEVLPIGREPEPIDAVADRATPAMPTVRPFPAGRRENWLRRTARPAR